MVREDGGLNKKGLWAGEAHESSFELQGTIPETLIDQSSSLRCGVPAKGKRYKILEFV